MIPSSPQVSVRRFAALVLVVGMALAASGCGRYGPLEPPNSSASADHAKPSNDPGAGFTAPRNPPITPPKAPFVLDPVL